MAPIRPHPASGPGHLELGQTGELGGTRCCGWMTPMPSASRPLVGISTYPPSRAGNYTLPEPYVSAVRRAGAHAVLLPPGATSSDGPDGGLAGLIGQLDGLVLTGGGDVDPALYGATPHDSLQAVNGSRDGDEMEMVRLALDSGLPTLAICRGMQVVNVALGGTLHQHLIDLVDGSIVHRDEERVAQGLPGPVPHVVECQAACLVAEAMGTTTPTPMSWHHQAVRDLGTGLRAVAWAPDGTIEALEHDSHPWLAIVQWHPELTAADDETQQRLFDTLVIACQDRQ